MNNDNFSEELLTIRNRFVESLPGRIHHLEEAMSGWAWSTTSRPDEAIGVLYNLTHQLMGTAGSVGFPELSNVAMEVNHKLREIQKKDNRVLTDDILDEIAADIAALSAEAKRCLRVDV